MVKICKFRKRLTGCLCHVESDWLNANDVGKATEQQERNCQRTDGHEGVVMSNKKKLKQNKLGKQELNRNY